MDAAPPGQVSGSKAAWDLLPARGNSANLLTFRPRRKAAGSMKQGCHLVVEIGNYNVSFPDHSLEKAAGGGTTPGQTTQIEDSDLSLILY